jgi:hypothetical protein
MINNLLFSNRALLERRRLEEKKERLLTRNLMSEEDSFPSF